MGDVQFSPSGRRSYPVTRAALPACSLGLPTWRNGNSKFILRQKSGVRASPARAPKFPSNNLSKAKREVLLHP